MASYREFHHGGFSYFNDDECDEAVVKKWEEQMKERKEGMRFGCLEKQLENQEWEEIARW